MAINSAVNIDINVDGTATVNQAASAYEDLGDAVSKTQLEAERLAQQFGINDKRTQEAIKVAGRYKQEMEQLDFAIDAARGGTDQFFRATQGVVAGFEVAAGAAAIFGGESEELEKILIKVQGAMALSQGLKDFNEFLPAIKNVTRAFTGPLTKAVQGFGKATKAALAASGIGLLVVALGSIVAYWDEIKAAVSGVSDEQKKLLADQEASAALAQEQLDDISSQENILRQQGKTEQQILNLKIAAAKNAIVALEAQLQTQKELKQAQVDAAKRNQEITQGILRFLTAPVTILLSAVDALTAGLQKVGAIDEATNLEGTFSKSLASFIFDPEETAKEADATIKETEDNITKLKNSVAGYEMSVTKIKEDGIKKRQEAEQKAADEQKAKDDEEYERFIALEIELDEFRKRQAEERKKREDEEFEAWLEQELARAEYAEQLAQEEIERQQAIQDAKEAIFNEAQTLADAIVGLAGEQSAVGKAIALAQIGADTARALSGALANANSPTPDNVATGGLAGIAKYIALATTILSNAKRAYSILKAPAPTSGGGSAPSVARPGVPQLNAPRLQSTLNADNQLFSERRVYVTESDITTTQKKVATTQKVSLVE